MSEALMSPHVAVRGWEGVSTEVKLPLMDVFDVVSQLGGLGVGGGYCCF